MSAARTRLPNRRLAVTHTITWGDQPNRLTINVSAGLDPSTGAVREVFVDCGKEGSLLAAITSDIAVVISVALQHGVPIEALARSILRAPIGPIRPDALNGQPVPMRCLSPIGVVLDVLAETAARRTREKESHHAAG